MDTIVPPNTAGPGAGASPAPNDVFAHVYADAMLSLERSGDFDALERQLLSFAVHPHGLAAQRAWLLVADDARESLRLERAAHQSDDVAPLMQAMRQHSGRLAVARDPAGGGLWIRTDRLELPLTRAWDQGVTSFGSGLQPGLPWHGMELGAMVLRIGVRRYALVVVAWNAGLPPAGRENALRALHGVVCAACGTIERAIDLQRRARHAAALRELARASVSVINLAEALRLAARLATHALGARGSALWCRSHDGAVRLDATHGPAGQREALGRALQPIAERVAAGGHVLGSDDVREQAGIPPDAASRLGAVLLAPMAAYGNVLGVLAVYDRAQLHPGLPPEFDAHDRACLEAIADLVALAIDQAERCDAQRSGEQQRRELVARVRRLEHLAAVGERATRLAQDARNAVATIAAFSRRVQRGRAADDPDREYLEIVIREAAQLERWMAAPLEPPPGETRSLRVESLNAAIQDVLQEAGETLVRGRVRLLKRMSPDVPSLRVDGDRMRRVLRDVLQHALERVGAGGRIRIESRRAEHHAVVDIAHDGPHQAGDLLEQLLVPFAGGGTVASGLRGADQLVREMGGEVRLRSEGEWSTLVSITLPIDGNQERRGRGTERRGPLRDRRSAPDAA